MCGGVLIASDVILTAAHCLEYVDFACLGVHDLQNFDEYHECFEIYPENKLQYPYDEPNAHDGDYKLLYLGAQSSLSTISIINAASDIPWQGEELTVMGWGQTETGYGSKVPLKTYLEAVTNSL